MSTDSFEEREQSWVIPTMNREAFALDQGRIVLDLEHFWVGDVVDKDGIEIEEIGMINCAPGRVIQVPADQLAAEVVGQTRLTMIYMAPGAGDLHITPAAGDYCVGKLYEDQGANLFIKLQTNIPYPVEAST